MVFLANIQEVKHDIPGVVEADEESYEGLDETTRRVAPSPKP
jgi:hypothetical protein